MSAIQSGHRSISEGHRELLTLGSHYLGRLMGYKNDGNEREPKALNKKYRNLSRYVHPDFNQDNVALADELSSAVNLAYKVLTNRRELLEYKLLARGGQSAGEDKTTDKMFLMEMMEFQEKIESELSDSEKTNLDTELKNMEDEKYDLAHSNLESENLVAARHALNEASYCRRLIKNLAGEHE